ncbi:MAG: glycosyltransferase [Candidatus Aenigmarchaeota archaeon]|nr:glycosyltransferase [Candidatus Aenigmarchaeota archaeon]
MKINFLVENFGYFKYLGSYTASVNLANALKKRGIDVQFNTSNQGFDIVHAHTFGPLVLKRFIGRKEVFVLTAHSIPSVNVGNVIGGQKLWNFVYRKIYNLFDHIIAPTNFSKNELESMGIHKEITVIPNLIYSENFRFDEEKRQRFRNSNSISDDDILVLMVGQKTPRKGVYDFIEIAKNLPEFKFIWVGGIPYKYFSSDYNRIRRVTNRKTNNLKFLGFVKDITEAYCGADIFLFPSYAEIFSLVPLEASSIGLPILMRKLKVYEEVYGNLPAYCSNITEFIQTLKQLENENTRKKLAKSCKKISIKYSDNNVVGKFIRFYERILS